jgi:dihydrofolate reductase
MEAQMRTLMMFNSISLDGYFTDNGDMDWAHSQDEEWNRFTSENASGETEFIFGRKTYEMMAAFWPTPQAKEMLPAVAASMNRTSKNVVSRSLQTLAWENSRLLEGDLVSGVRRLKQQAGPNLLVMGSGEVVAQLSGARLIDDYQLVVVPIVLGHGRSLFDGVTGRPRLKLAQHRAFRNGNVVLSYKLGE